ncbi:MAG: TIM barrel protein [Brachybacterium sp.]|nr:TIM barrel protein [Brachybacterium sp.]MDN6328623.1 TIM barrel protein [Brachybacterium sp.]
MDPEDLALNCSLALRDIDPRERASTAAALGYSAVEFWWPFAEQHPRPEQIREFVDDVRRAQLPAVLLNFPGGGPAVEERGLLSVPGREDDFLRAAETSISIGRQIGTTRYNPMAGNITGTWVEGSQEFETALTNLLRVAPLAAEADATIVLEPLSGFPRAALTTFTEAESLVRAARREGAGNVAVLHDLFHAAVNEDPVLTGAPPASDLIGHVQIADHPGRGWPGTGELPLAEWIDELRRTGYDGYVGIECHGGQPRAAHRALVSD